MKSRIAESILASLTITALLLISCGPRAVAPTPTTTPTPTLTAPTPAAPTPVTSTPTPATPAPAASVEKPKYGGTFSLVTPTDVDVWDTGVSPSSETLGSCCNHDQLSELIWERGLAGTGEFDYGAGYTFESHGPGLAESWKILGTGHWIFQIRRGIHYQMPAEEANKREAHRLVGGREMTVDDIIYNFTRLTKTNRKISGIGTRQPLLSDTAKFEKTGPWELTIKFPEDPFTGWFWLIRSNWGFHAPEAMQKYGDVKDWRNRVGTGPFIVTDFVPGSMATLVRSPNHWRTNPVGPGKGDQLPYIDTLKYLVIPDLSTRLAVMRTGRADWLEAVQGEDARSLLKTGTSLKFHKYLPSSTVVAGRVDKLGLPFANKKVRHALMMATDMEAIKNLLYDGEAEIMNWPLSPTVTGAHVPLAELPKAVQELYRYDPEKAKRLLSEAGFPNGFKTKMIVQNSAEFMDVAATIKAMWEKVGVIVEVQPRERVVFTGITNTLSHEELILRTTTSFFPASYPSMTNIRGPSQNNVSLLNEPIGSEPRIEKMFQEIQKHVIINQKEADRIYREEFTPYVLELADRIPIPAPYLYRVWQPWVKNYYGEAWGLAAKYLWIDQDLKEQMTGRR